MTRSYSTTPLSHFSVFKAWMAEERRITPLRNHIAAGITFKQISCALLALSSLADHIPDRASCTHVFATKQGRLTNRRSLKPMACFRGSDALARKEEQLEQLHAHLPNLPKVNSDAFQLLGANPISRKLLQGTRFFKHTELCP